MNATTQFSIGDRVLTDTDLTGRIINIRFDSSGDPLFTVRVDDPDITPDGFYIARVFELRGVS